MELQPYTAMLLSQFEACPTLLYNLSTVGDGDLDVNHHSDKVLDMRGDRIHREFKVKNAEELHNLTKALLNKPMLFDTELAHQRTEQLMDCNIGARLTDFFVVLVNTRDPRIRELLTHRLVQAMQYMQEGKNFCLKLNFGASMKQWFSENVDREEAGCLTSRYNTDYGSMTIWVTNCSTPSTEFCGTMLF
ncbi:uncharacterized protein [Argopecten irradians]|uniref:uncharacterized protein n=1 Tax=Argopecten irradians TaxID=31199 RepID=UPI00370F7DE2